MKTRWMLAILILGAGPLLGCGGGESLENVVPAGGTITQGGSPLAGATVTFMPADSAAGLRAASGMTDDSGRFELTTLTAGDGAMPGNYQVTVTKIKVTSEGMTTEEAQEYVQKHHSPPPSTSENLVAEKYSRSGTSGLTATVTDSDNDFTFEVE